MALSTQDILSRLRDQLKDYVTLQEGREGLAKSQAVNFKPNNPNSIGFSVVTGLNDPVDEGLFEVSFGGWPDDSIGYANAVAIIESLVRGNVWRTDGNSRTKWEVLVGGQVERSIQIEGWKGLISRAKYNGRYKYEPYATGLDEWKFDC